MSAAYEELVELLDQRGIGYWASEHQAVRLDLRGQVAVYRITAEVEPETDLFQVGGRSPVLVSQQKPTPATRPGPGLSKGMITYMAPDFDAPLDDFREYME